MSQSDIKKAVTEEGFSPVLVTDSPGFVYEEHHHKETKLLACLKGTMNVVVNREPLVFEPGDKLIIPGNIHHSAVVGTDGCQYFWAEKVL